LYLKYKICLCESYDVIQVISLMNGWKVLISFSSYEAFFAREEEQEDLVR